MITPACATESARSVSCERRGWLPPGSSQRLGRCWFVERNASSVMALHGATRKTGGVISCESLQPTVLSHQCLTVINEESRRVE